ncbi:MAG: ankyrin repeat domain-containing protein [Leptospirales bacterium]
MSLERKTIYLSTFLYLFSIATIVNQTAPGNSKSETRVIFETENQHNYCKSPYNSDFIISRNGNSWQDQKSGSSMASKEDYKLLLKYADEGEVKELKALINKSGVDLNHTDRSGDTALHLAASRGHLEVVQLLVASGANVNVQNLHRKSSPLHNAAYNGHLGIVEYLLKNNAEVDIADNSGQTPLSFAARQGKLNVFKELLRHGADINTRNSYEMGVLHWAVYSKSAELVEYILSYKKSGGKDYEIDVNAKNRTLETPLHIAAKKGLLTIAKLLLKYGADPTLENSSWDTPYNLAKYSHPETAKIVDPLHFQYTDAQLKAFKKIHNYKVLLIAGDSSIDAFDNAREKIQRILIRHGVKTQNIKQLTRKKNKTNSRVLLATNSNIEKSFKELNIGRNDICFIFMTSHGNDTGFMLGDLNMITPSQMDTWINSYCKSQPTILIVSACYSGIFLKPGMRRANRVILTASRDDKTSFGCGAEEEYTYYDTCLIDSLGSSKNWKEVANSNKACIDRKEKNMSEFSYPQSYFGVKTGYISWFQE